MICQSWKVMFQAEYSSGQPLRMLVDLRAAIDDALGRRPAVSAIPKPAAASIKPAAPTKAIPQAAPAPKPAAAPKAMAAKAAAPSSAPKFNVAKEETPEFEISVGNQEWNPDSGN
jgi:hypothetical protein